ncbi:MAG: SAM-dependent methyltransferase [Pyrinomonadaceae bacterium]
MIDPNSSNVAARLRERINREGAITFRDWMEAALYDSREGYYCRPDLTRWGRAGGDYRTSPERSPLFAATFARHFAALHQSLGSPRALTIIEAGAGAGHFACGVLETLRRSHASVFDATRYLIDEASADARHRAQARLRPFDDRVEFRRLNEIESPIDACIIFSNELLDAFPVHRVTQREGRLFELCVGLSDSGDFVWVEREPTTPLLAAYLERARAHLAEGQIIEINLDAEEWMMRAASVLKRGYVVTVDYGAETSELYGAPHRYEGTLRAFHQHRLIDDALARPGEQDITTTIDWTCIKKVGEECGLRTISFERQDQFLLRVGLLDQLEIMTANASTEADALILRAGAREMILPGGLSTSFQVLVQKR